MAPCKLRHCARCQGGLWATAQRHALPHLPEQRTARSHFAATAYRRWFLNGSRRPTRARAFPRAHGFQRHQKSHRGRAHPSHATPWHRLRCPRECLYVVRRNGLHARPAGHVGRNDEARLHRDARLRRWRFARLSGNRQGTRRDPRGKSEPGFGRLPPHATAVFQSTARLARHAAFPDRRGRNHPQSAARELH